MKPNTGISNFIQKHANMCVVYENYQPIYIMYVKRNVGIYKHFKLSQCILYWVW